MSEVPSDFDFACSFDEIGILEKSDSAVDNSKRRMYGWASTPHIDADNEKVLQEGLVLDDLLSRGWVNWNHQSEKIIGIPKVAELRDRGNDFGKGLWTEFELLQTPLADEVWGLAKALKDSGRSLGQSLEGKRLAKKNNTVIKAKVMNLAVCPNPKNPETTVEAFSKALVADDTISSEAFEPFALVKSDITNRVESLVSSAITNAVSSCDSSGNNSQESIVDTEEYISLSKSARENLLSLKGDLHGISKSLVNISDDRGGNLTKAESALCTFLLSKNVSLLKCFEIFDLCGGD